MRETQGESRGSALVGNRGHGTEAIAFAFLPLLAACVGPSALEAENADLAPPRLVDFSIEEPREEPLPDCASPLFRAIHHAARFYADGGTVPAPWMASRRNVAGTQPWIEVDTLFPEVARLVEQARYEVDVQTFTWDTDTDPARELLAALARLEDNRRREPTGHGPVVVRILADMMIDTAFRLIDLSAALEELDLDPELVRVEIAAWRHSFLDSLHSKSIIIDGEAAIVTGANFGPAYDYVTGEHDAAFVFGGEVALSLLADFDDAWRRGQRWICGASWGPPPDGTSSADCFDFPEAAPHAVADRPIEEDVCSPMLVVGRGHGAVPFVDEIDNPQDRAFLAAFAHAGRIRVDTPNLNDEAARRGLMAALKRGATVELILSKNYEDFNETLPGQGGTNVEVVREMYDELESSGVADPCSVLRVRWYSRDGVRPVEGNTVRANHVKYASFDGRVSIVGSANMDTQSWNHSREIDVVVDDPAVTAAWDAAIFEHDFAQSIPVERCAEPGR